MAPKKQGAKLPKEIKAKMSETKLPKEVVEAVELAVQKINGEGVSVRPLQSVGSNGKKYKGKRNGVKIFAE